MIFGKPNDYKCPKHLWFAWRPVVLTNGQVAWLQRVNREWGSIIIHDMIGAKKLSQGWVYTKAEFVAFE